MTELLTAATVVVQQQREFLSQRNDYELFTPSGDRLGFVQERSGSGKALFGKLADLQLDVYDADRQPLLLLQKPGGFGRSHFGVWLADGTELGAVDQENLVFAPQFVLTAVDGSSARLTGGELMSREWALSGPAGEPLGRLTKPWAGIAEIFTAADDYVVELAPTLTGPLRSVALASCICLDVVRDLRKRNRGAGGAGAG